MQNSTIRESLLRSSRFIRRAVRLRMVLPPIDRRSPFSGALAEQGLFDFTLSEHAVESLRGIYGRSRREGDDERPRVELRRADTPALTEIFDQVTPQVRSYLGEESFLDGLAWFVTTTNDARSISSNWHTDNVGNRISVFVCIQGDGSQPTALIPSRNRVPSVFDWITGSMWEVARWAGFEQKRRFGRETQFRHKTGTVFMFDTQLLHRGAYENASGDRVVLGMEFSNPAKHAIAFGPVGTFEHNAFVFDRELMEIASFSRVLDRERVQSAGDRLSYSR